jgi:hypothetical protein
MRHKALIILYAILTISCGTEGGTSSPDQTAPKTQSKPDETQDLPEYQTFYVQTEDDLGKCNGQKKDWLMYVRSSKAFFSCDGRGWAEVDVPTEVAEADPLAWVDTLRDMTWHLIGSYSGSQMAQGVHLCDDEGLVMPTADEVVAAVQSGMWAHYSEISDGAFDQAFGLRETGADFNHRVINLSTGVGEPTGAYTISFNGDPDKEKWTFSSTAGVYCYE